MFSDADIISCYTWDDAVNDGTFINVSRMAKKAGFSIPVAVTSNLFYTHLEKKTTELTDRTINAFLMLLAIYIKSLKERGKADSTHIVYPAEFENDKVVQVWATIEARSPLNPEPVMTLCLPSDY